MVTERSSAKRYGIRYGRSLREKIGKIEKERRDTNICPYCHYQGKLERQAAGIWHCKKCSVKFSARAHVVGKKLVGQQETELVSGQLAESESVEVPAKEPSEEETVV